MIYDYEMLFHGVFTYDYYHQGLTFRESFQVALWNAREFKKKSNIQSYHNNES